MGAQQSMQNDELRIKTNKIFINDIAVNYIENGTYADMINLTNKEKCQQTVILTKDIIRKHMTKVEIESLHNELYKDALTEMYVSPLLKLQSDNEIKCKQIAEHYVLIGNIFNMIKKSFLLNDDNKANSDKEANLCVNRLNRIKLGQDESKPTINISKNVCKSKITPDIDNLVNLYGHNYKHNKISDKEKNRYDELNQYINTSKDLIAKHETTFDDEPYEVESTNSLVYEYNEIIKNIEDQIRFSQLKLINILHKVFEYDENKNIKIKDSIDGVNIETLAKKTLEIVNEMYLTCENEFHKSVEFQEKIHRFKSL